MTGSVAMHEVLDRPSASDDQLALFPESQNKFDGTASYAVEAAPDRQADVQRWPVRWRALTIIGLSLLGWVLLISALVWVI